MNPYLRQVADFNSKFGLDGLCLAQPGFPNDDLMSFRLNFMLEELVEMAEAAGFGLNVVKGEVTFVREKADKDRDLVKYLDGHLDLQYVLTGTALFSGFGSSRFDQELNFADSVFDLGFTRVHRANMRKVRLSAAEGVNAKRNPMFDVVKPTGWVPPKLEDLVT